MPSLQKILKYIAPFSLVAAFLILELHLGSTTTNSTRNSTIFLWKEKLNKMEEEPQIHVSKHDSSNTSSSRRRNMHCQFVYILGVEGVSHHGFEPILRTLASLQKDPKTDISYDIVARRNQSVRFALYGQYGAEVSKVEGEILALGFNYTPPLDDPLLVQRLFADVCPQDGQKHVILEWHSFPSGNVRDKRPFRVYRQSEWSHMTSEEIAHSESAQNHPFNLTAFYEAYSPYADIKFIVLHRPYMETIASHASWDSSTVVHSEITRAFIYILQRFLDKYKFDPITGERLWHTVCMQHIFSKFYDDDESRVKEARQSMMEDLANFLHWPIKECPSCFDSWRESSKDYVSILTEYGALDQVRKHAESLNGIWPPPSLEEDDEQEGQHQQHCSV